MKTYDESDRCPLCGKQPDEADGKCDVCGEDIESPYCEVCGGCGYIGCDGIRDFLKKHVEGKTDCKNEDGFISEIIAYCEDNGDEMLPMGVSQWKAYGKRYGYWDYFEHKKLES